MAESQRAAEAGYGRQEQQNRLGRGTNGNYGVTVIKVPIHV